MRDIIAGILGRIVILGTPDRILRTHRQNVAALIACGGEAESASVEKWHRDYRLRSEHGFLNANRSCRFS
jgi:hypothetical protein